MTTADNAQVSERTDRPAPEQQGDVAFLALGDSPAAVEHANFVTTAAALYGAILMTRHVEPAELAAVLDQARDPAVPIADFGYNAHLRRDYDGRQFDDTSFGELRRVCWPIWQRLDAIPFRSSREDRAELTTLRLAYARNAPIEARFSADLHLAVGYPLLGIGVAVRNQLEFLADMDLLRRRHFTRTHQCGRCGSSRLNVYECCANCGGANLNEEMIVHHYRCGWQAPESQFAQGPSLVCPKCRRELRHLGIDYGKPGVVLVCRTCNVTNSEPMVSFACLECSWVTKGEDAAVTDWYHYDLTGYAIEALRDGRLPRFDLGPMLNGRPRTFSRGEFLLLAKEGMRVAERYKRPFAVARLTIANIEGLRAQIGSTQMGVAFALVVEEIVNSLRVSDFVTATGATSVAIGFPETSESDVAAIVDRIRAIIHKATSADVEIAVEIAEGDEIGVFLAAEVQP